MVEFCVLLLLLLLCRNEWFENDTRCAAWRGTHNTPQTPIIHRNSVERYQEPDCCGHVKKWPAPTGIRRTPVNSWSHKRWFPSMIQTKFWLPPLRVLLCDVPSPARTTAIDTHPHKMNKRKHTQKRLTWFSQDKTASYHCKEYLQVKNKTNYDWNGQCYSSQYCHASWVTHVARSHSFPVAIIIIITIILFDNSSIGLPCGYSRFSSSYPYKTRWTSLFQSAFVDAKLKIRTTRLGNTNQNTSPGGSAILKIRANQGYTVSTYVQNCVVMKCLFFK